jgi:RimJ/RimL family protein N-acetyltransferase
VEHRTKPVSLPLAYTVRPICPEDAPLLNDFHERCSEQTHRLRFFSSQAHLSSSMLRFFTNVDHDQREALVALMDGRIIAVGRYDVVPADEGAAPAAEVAFVVVDEFHGRGIATDLLGRLVESARTHGIRTFVAETLTENMAMQSVFRKSPYNASFHRIPGDPSVLRCTMTL